MNKKWIPVEDGFTREEVTFQGRHTERVSVTQDWLTVAWRPETGDEYKASAQLPDDIRLCRLTDDAPGDMPRYSHRNGETEPPTTKGNYWVKGFATINGAIMRLSLMLTVADWRDSAMYAKLPDGGLVTVRGTSTGFASAEWNCEWWGPVMPPWEANNE